MFDTLHSFSLMPLEMSPKSQKYDSSEKEINIYTYEALTSSEMSGY